MKRLVLVAALLVGACGTTDDRPRTLDYITQTILAPTCAAAPCHSAFKQAAGDQFDTTDAARLSIVRYAMVDPGDPPSSDLYRSITEGITSAIDHKTKVRMPYDAPLPDVDVQLILAWIGDGAEGAQCAPNASGEGCTDTVTVDAMGNHIHNYRVVKCPDGNIGATVTSCTAGTVCSINLENGKCATP